MRRVARLIATAAAPVVHAVAVKAATRATGNQMLRGQQLTAGQAIVSANGSYRFIFRSDGNAVLTGPGSRVLWSTRTANKAGARIALHNDGNLVLRTAAGKALWTSGTAGKGGVRLTVGNDGNLVLRTAAGKAVWSTKPANPGDTKNCSSFATRAQAQAWFDRYYPYYGDVARLDSDKDRKACETLP